MAVVQFLHTPQKWSDEQLKLAAAKNVQQSTVGDEI